MSDVILFSVLSLGAIAGFAAIALFFVAKKFHVEEDPRIDDVAAILPGANCGGCGYAGCRGLSEALVKAAENGDISGLLCPPGGGETMKAIGKYLELEVQETEPITAVIHCSGDFEKAPRKHLFDGAAKCSIAATVSSGEKGCAYSCLGYGDCVVVCQFDAIYMDKKTGLPVVDAKKCVGCGACAKACPRKVISIRPEGRNGRRVWVGCSSRDKGAVAMKACKAACIGCGKCVKECPEKIQAITLNNNLAFIDPKKCIACGKCIVVCPTKAIKATFEPPMPKVAEKTEVSA